LQLIGTGPEPLARRAGDRDARPEAGEQLGRREPDPLGAAAARNERRPAGEVEGIVCQLHAERDSTCSPAPQRTRESTEEKRLAGLDAAAVRVAAIRKCSVVAPVALDFPALPADGDVPTESPRTLVGVLVALLVVPGVELRIGQHLAQLVARDVCERGKTLAVAEARSLR